MSVDFRTRQLRVNQIINSGSTATSPLLIYGMGSATDDSGGITASHFTTGSDTWLFISGSSGSKNSSARGVVAFKGDVVISGTIYNAAGAAYSTSGGGGGTSNWNELSPSPRLNSTASVAIAGALGSSYAAQSAGADVFFFVSGTSGVSGASARKSLFGGDVVTSGSHYVIGNVTGANAQFSGDIAVNGGDITTTASTFNVAPSATTLNLGSSTGKVVVPGDFEVQGTTVTVDVSNITVEDPLISLGFTTGSVAGSAGDRGFIGGISGAGNNVAFAWSNNSGSFVATKTTSTAGSTSVAVTSLQPIRASSFQVNGTTAFITSSDSSTLVASGTAVQLKAATGDKISFFENGSEYISFSRSGGSSALIRSTEAAFPSLYISGSSVHIDSYSGLTWFDSNSNGGLVIDSSNTASPKIFGRIGSGSPVNLTISGSDLVLGSNSGQILLYRGASEFLRATYNGASDTVVSAQSLNLSVGSNASTQLSGSTVSLNHGAGVINFQRHGSNFATISSGSGDFASLIAAAGKQFQIGGTGLTKLTGSLIAISAGSTGISLERDNTAFFNISQGPGAAILSASNQIALRPATGVTQVTGTLEITSNVTASNLRLSGDIQLNGGDIQTTAGSVNLFTDANATNITIGGYNHRYMTLMDGANPASSAFYVAKDKVGLTELYLATGPTDNNYKNIWIGSNTLANSLTYIYLGSNVANSYGKTTIYTTETDIKGRVMITGSLYAPMMSGSLTKLTDGSNYLRAGSNVTLTTGSDGSVTIASTGGSGSPAGSNTQVQFNADGAFAATSGLTFATGSSSLTITGDLAVNGGDITTTESTATIFSTNVSSLSLASVASTVSVGGSSSSTSFTLNVAANRTGNSTLNLGTGATSTGNAKNVNIGQGGDPGSTTNIRLGTTDTGATTNIYMSGSVYVTGSVGMKGSIVPDATATYTLGTDDLRWAHVYTGDLHLRNERGDWTVIEENDFLRIVNNKTGKNYKMLMQLIDD